MENHDTLKDWLSLHLAPHASTRTWQTLLRKGYTAKQLCQLGFSQLSKLGLKTQTIQALLHPNKSAIEKLLSWTQAPNHHLIPCTSRDYPALLSNIPDPPLLLYVKGNLPLLFSPQLAIVGSRNPSTTGKTLASFFAGELAKLGFTLTSGMANGIDTEVHTATLNAQGKTIAVLGSGLEVLYPKNNSKLACKIIENGAIISEFAPNQPPKRHQFPQRNRIISGLCLGTLVIEASQKSGSLISAAHAVEQGREVFVTPGSLLNPQSSGCHKLIQQGAKLITCVNDILEELPNLTVKETNRTLSAQKQAAPLDEKEKHLLTSMGFDLTYFEQIVLTTGFSASEVSAMLCNLILNGYIREEMGGYSQIPSGTLDITN